MGDDEGEVTLKVLLDTCCIIWSASDPDQLTSQVSSVLRAEGTEVFVSPISCAEIACLSDSGRIVLDRHWKLWFNQILALNQWQIADINLTVVQEAYSLPGDFHRDPADRIITATARLYGAAILTADKKILNYPHVSSIW